MTRVNPTGKLDSTEVTGLPMHVGLFKMCLQAFISNVTENCSWISHRGIHILLRQSEIPAHDPAVPQVFPPILQVPVYRCQTVGEIYVYSENMIYFGFLCLCSNNMDLRSKAIIGCIVSARKGSCLCLSIASQLPGPDCFRALGTVLNSLLSHLILKIFMS